MKQAATKQGNQVTEDWAALRTLGIYRWSIAVLLIGLWWSEIGNRLLPGVNEAFIPVLCGLYLVTCPLLSLSLLARKPGYKFQVYVNVSADILLTTILVMVSGGISSGLGVLMLTPVAGIGTLIPRRISILLAAVASLSLLGEEIFRDAYSIPPVADYTLAGLLGILIFIVTFAANTLAQRAKASEKLAEQRGIDLANLSHLNERIIHHMTVGVVVLDENNSIRMLNQAATRLLNAHHSAVLRRQLTHIAPELGPQLHEWRLGSKTTHDGEPVDIGSHRILPHFSSLGQANGPAIVFLEDATRFSEQAQQIKLAALGRLTASIAHEIRNPLGAISHASQLIQDWENTADEELRLFGIIDRHCRRINEIVENVLNLSKRQETFPQSFNLEEWLNQTTEDYGHTEFGRKCQFDLEEVPFDLHVRFDPGHLWQVVENLWDNACQHGHKENADTIIKLQAGIDASTRRPFLDICDQGPGIPSDLVEQVFEPFFTGINNGTGLGLYLARELCECNNASLRYISQPDQGARFRILFANTLEWAA